MPLSKENMIKGLMEVTKKIEEGGEVDSNTRKIVEEFLNNFPPPTTTSTNLSHFPAELLQLIFSYLPLVDLKSALLVNKRWKGVGESSTLWEDKKLVIEGESMTMSCAVEAARRRKMQTIQAIGLSSDQVKEVAMGMKSSHSWTERIGPWWWGPRVCWSFPNQCSSSTAFQECISQLIEDQLVKRQSHSRAARLPLLLLEPFPWRK